MPKADLEYVKQTISTNSGMSAEELVKHLEGWTVDEIQAVKDDSSPAVAVMDKPTSAADVNAALAELKTKADVVEFAKQQYDLDLDVSDSRDDLESAIKAEAKRARKAA